MLEIGLEEWLRLIAAEDREVCEKRFAAALRRPGDYRAEYRIDRGGEMRWIAVQGSVVLDAAGRPFRVVGVAQDVSERKRGEAALRDSERRLRELNESLERLAEERARQRDASRARLQAVFDNSPDWLAPLRMTEDGRRRPAHRQRGRRRDARVALSAARGRYGRRPGRASRRGGGSGERASARRR